MVNSCSKKDIRCVKTRKSIRKALISILLEKELSGITITQISQVAMVNRKTFYAHYNGIPDVINDIEHEISRTLDDIFGEDLIIFDGHISRSAFERAAIFIYTDFDFYSRLIKSPYSGDLLLTAQSTFSDIFYKAVVAHTKAAGISVLYAVDFVAAGVLSVYKRWLLSEEPGSLKYVSNLTCDFAADCIEKFITYEPNSFQQPNNGSPAAQR